MKHWGFPRWVAFSLLGLLVLLPAGAAAPAAQAGTGNGTGTSTTTATGPNPRVSATGIATVAGGPAPASSGPRTLNVGVQVQVQGSDLQSGVQQANQKIAAVEAALVTAGIAKSAIRLQNFNVGPQYGPPAMYANGAAAAKAAAIQAATAPKQVTGFMINENLQVSVSGLTQLAAAMSAAISAGATSVNSYTGCCFQNGSPPSGSTMSTAIAQATAQATAEAQAAAQAAGVTLGNLYSVTVAPPNQQGPIGPSTAPSWRVQVTVSYEIAS